MQQMKLFFCLGLALGLAPRPGLLAVGSSSEKPLRGLVAAYLKKEVTRAQLLHRAADDVSKMDWKEAQKGLGKELPKEVTALLTKGAEQKADKQPFDEAALDRARTTLNGMIETAQEEYDLKDMECSAFHENNRAEYEQTVADLARLGSALASDLAAIIGSKGNIESTQRMLDDEKDMLESAMEQCLHTKTVDEAQLSILESDLAIAEFIVHMTKCSEDEKGFMHLESTQTANATDPTDPRHAMTPSFVQQNAPAVEQCPMDGGPFLTFSSPELAQQQAKLMSKEAQQALQIALMSSHPEMKEDAAKLALAVSTLRRDRHDESAHEKLALIGHAHRQLRQLSSEVGRVELPRAVEDPEYEEKSGGDSYYEYYYPEEEVSMEDMMNSVPEPVVTPPATEPDPAKAASKCVNSKPDCGLLNDNMALMWGQVKDAVDELRSRMAANQKACTETENMHNVALQTFTETIMTKNVEITDGTKNLNENTQEQTERNMNKDRLDKEYEEEMSACEKILHEILHTNICGVKTVRAEISTFSKSYGPTDILDCVVSDWVPQECSATCEPGLKADGTCDAGGMEVCLGGIQNMTRDVVQQGNETDGRMLGAACPAMKLERVCNKIPCKVDCNMDDWSPYGKCSKECGGGVMSKGRNIVWPAANGGESCTETSETVVCNGFSCDVDCVLADWTVWGPCSRACGVEGGRQERTRPVVAEQEGFGVCPPKAVVIFEEQTCNAFACPEFPTCHAMQDLVLVVDVSGSLKKDGFTIVENFLNTLIKLYDIGENTTKIGVVEYSDVGKIVAPLQEDPEALSAEIAKNLFFQRGVTDMAMGMQMATTVLQEGRKDASSVVIVLTDGKPSFQWATMNRAKALRDSGARLVMVPIFQYGDPVFMKELASEPSHDNVLEIPGLEHLAANMEAEATKLMTSTCALLEQPEGPAAAEGLVGKDGKGEEEYKFLFPKKSSTQSTVRNVRHRRGHEVS